MTVTTAACGEGAGAASPIAEPAAVRAHRTRADALRNRERIVAAAGDIFVEYGPDAPLDEIARRAGIGNATLYRHFADRRALTDAVLLSVAIRTAKRAESAARLAAAGADPTAELSRFAHSAVDDRIAALCGLFVDRDDCPSSEVAAQSARLEAAVGELMERAKKDGGLRSDVTVKDLVLAMSRLTRPLPGVDRPVGELHRHLQLFLDGLKAPNPNQND